MKTMAAALMLGGCLLALGCSTSGLDRYTFVSEHSGKCASLPVGGGYSAGDSVEQWDCSHYHMGLQGSWRLEPTGAANTHRVISIHSGLCLAVATSTGGGKSNGDAMQQAHCTTAANQQWLVKPASSTKAGAWTFKSVHSGKCMQVRFGTTGGKQDGDDLEQWDCKAGVKHQSWILNRVDVPNPPLDTGEGELCNVCNPAQPNCKSGALCLVLNTGQSVCGQSCVPSTGCPTGYTCKTIPKLGTTYTQCVPNDESCPD